MKAKYDIDDVELSQGYVDALTGVLSAEVEMMRAADPQYADDWYWGRAAVGNLADTRSIEFQYGAEENMPDDGHGRFAVIVAE
jgi:hypothetical protein